MTVSAYEKFKVKLLGAPEASGTRCYLLHSWTKWDPYTIAWGHPMAPMSLELRQRRACTRCGRVQDQKVQLITQKGPR